jgi:hypothetical protein
VYPENGPNTVTWIIYAVFPISQTYGGLLIINHMAITANQALKRTRVQLFSMEQWDSSAKFCCKSCEKQCHIYLQTFGKKNCSTYMLIQQW